MATIARRGMARVAARREADSSDYLDPDLAALCEAFFFSRNAPLGTRENPMLQGMEGGGEEGESARGKPLCASVEGFSLHAPQAVPAEDREALESATPLRASRSLLSGATLPATRWEGRLPHAPPLAERPGSHPPHSRTAGLPAAVGGVGLVPVFPPDSAPRDSCRSTSISGATAAAITIASRAGGGISRDGRSR